MRFVVGITLLVSFLLPLGAQEENGGATGQMARVIGDILDGSPSEPAAPKVFPESEILSTKVVRDKGRTITMRRVAAPPVLPAPSEPRELSEEELAAIETFRNSDEFERSPELGEAKEFCFVSATVYDERITRVMWWHKNEPFVAWSNMDWNVMSGFHEFEGRGQRFLMIMGVGAGKVAAHQANDPEFTLPELPDLLSEGPKYLLVSGNEENEVALKFMDALHDLYEAEGPRLKEARLLRDKHRKEREAFLKANPPRPQDTTIHFWPRNSSRSPEPSESK